MMRFIPRHVAPRVPVAVTALKGAFMPMQRASGSVGYSQNNTIQQQKRYAASFTERHLGHRGDDTAAMLKIIGHDSVDAMMKEILPADIARGTPLKESPGLSEAAAVKHLHGMMSRNKLLKPLIGQGYYESITPPVIQRNVLENPYWYTPYTPYQAEISQGRLESLLNFQTVIADLTKMDVANASLLDQATAAGEAMFLAFQVHKHKRHTFYVSNNVFRSVIEMLRTRAAPLKINLIVGPISECDLKNPDLCGILTQTPDKNGALHDFTELFAKAKESGIISCCGTDLLASCIVKPAGEMGADVVIGSAQRFGIPLGYGGPSAAFFSVRDEYKRFMPGRLVGISKDANGNMAVRLALQTREQHIKRERATSNVCTAQALLANMTAFYAVYHGADGLREIAKEVHRKTKIIAAGLEAEGFKIHNSTFFDTLTFTPKDITPEAFDTRCTEMGLTVFWDPALDSASLSVDEATTDQNVAALLEATGMERPNLEELGKLAEPREVIPGDLVRKSEYLTAPVFKQYRCEHELMRYIQRLGRKDYGLTHGMIPLGSCTMKLNPAACMLPLSWPSVHNLHPLAPKNHCRGYEAMCIDLANKLKDVTGLAAVSLQPNSGAQGEYAGLRCIRAYHQSKGEGHRTVCLIPESAHGTNPASAVLAGMDVVVVPCTKEGPINLVELDKKLKEHGKNLACIMITYPSTYGLFDKDIKKITSAVHEAGGQVYIDGANLNAMVGYTGPGFLGGDVCHMNLHKTFSIPHGGGGPGVGPIAVAEHLAPYLPNAVYGPTVGGSKPFGQVSQSAFGSASILTISYMLLTMLGSEGLAKATAYAILNANYLRCRLSKDYHILYTDEKGYCGHEFILDLRPFKKTAGIEAEDVAKRLMDYGFHAPTLAFPVPGTLMIEPTESESKQELDRLADALLSIRQEIRDIEEGKQPKTGNVLKNAPHTASVVCAEKWDRPYSREVAAFPSPHSRIEKFWPSVGRIDGAYGDRNLMCSCAGIEAFMSKTQK